LRLVEDLKILYPLVKTSTSGMKSKSKAEITDITKITEHETYLYKCLAPMPFRKFKGRREYLEKAIPKGFHKKLLFFNGTVVG
jgi:hypothetical protein